MKENFNNFDPSIPLSLSSSAEETTAAESPSESLTGAEPVPPRPSLVVRLLTWLGLCQTCFRWLVQDAVFYTCKMVMLMFSIAIGVAAGMNAQKPIVLQVTPNGQPPQPVAAKPCGCGQTPTPIAANDAVKAPLIPVPIVPVDAVFRK